MTKASLIVLTDEDMLSYTAKCPINKILSSDVKDEYLPDVRTADAVILERAGIRKTLKDTYGLFPGTTF